MTKSDYTLAEDGCLIYFKLIFEPPNLEALCLYLFNKDLST